MSGETKGDVGTTGTVAEEQPTEVAIIHMTAPDTSRRQGLQFHLSTALAIVVVAGAWIGVTVCYPTTFLDERDVFPDDPDGTLDVKEIWSERINFEQKGFGFPWPSFFPSHSPPIGYVWDVERSATIRWGALAGDILFLLCVIMATFIVSECVIWRRTPRRLISPRPQ